MLKTKSRKTIVYLLAVVMCLSVAMLGVQYLPFGIYANAAPLDLTDLTALPTTAGSTLSNGGRYIVSSDTTITAGTDTNGLIVSGTVVIYIPTGVTLTVKGGAGSAAGNGGSPANASATGNNEGSNSPAGTAGGGGKGGKAGIYVPSGATLIVVGGGTLKATGGAGGKAGNGGKGANAACVSGTGWRDARTGGGGGGGGGAGGGGAGIGGNGGNGGDGGAGGAGFMKEGSNILGVVSADGDTTGNPGGDGSVGNNGGAAGTVYEIGSVTITATGGAGGASGSGGGYGGRDNTGKDAPRLCAAGGAGGGGGGAGKAGADIGGGGGAGGGAGGGGGGGYWYSSKKEYWWRYSLGGSGGASGGGNGSDSDSSSANNPSSGGSGKGQGSNGGNGTYNTTTTKLDAFKCAVTLNSDQANSDGHGSTSTDFYIGANPDNITVPSKTYYEFQGYYTRENGGGTKIYGSDGKAVSSMKPWAYKNSSLTLYAYFAADLDVTYHWLNSNGSLAAATADEHTINGATPYYDFTQRGTPGNVTINGVSYTWVGWRVNTTVPAQDATSGIVKTDAYRVYPSSPNKDFYAVYKTTQTANFYYYNASGARPGAASTPTVYYVAGASNNPTQATFNFPNPDTTITTDNRTFTFLGWRTDTTPSTATDTFVNGTRAQDIQSSAYNYYAVYSGDVTVSYNLNERYNDGTDAVTGTVPANSATQYLVADNASVANASRTSPAIAVNPGNVQLSRVGADAFLGWSVIANGADTESETATYPVTLAADASGALTIDTNTTLTAIFKDSRKTVKFLKPNGDAIDTQTIRYNYGGDVPWVDPAAFGEQTDGSNHYFFNGWTQNNTQTDLYDDDEYHYTFDRVKDHVNFTASYTGQAHRWAQDDLATTAVSCNGVAGEGHAFVDGGYHRYCVECGYGENDTVGNYSANTYVTVEAAAENYIMTTGNRPATCTAAGSTGKQQCKLCFKLISEATDIDPLGEYNETTGRYEHNMQPKAAPEGANYTLKECSVCGHEERYYNADEHTLVYRAQRDATCTEEGYRVNHFLCTDEGCGKLFADIEAKTELNATEVVIAAPGHDWQHTEGKAATCIETGLTAGNVCSRCGAPENEAMIIPEKGHPEDESQYETTEAVVATCQHAGREEYTKCLACGTVISGGEEIPQLQHKWSGLRVEMPTCTEAGRSYRVCENEGCDADPETEGCQAAIKDDEYEELQALGHRMKLVSGKAATCTEAGVKDYYECERCHRITSDAAGENEIAAEAFDEWKVIEAIGHQMGDPQSFDPTCTEAGYTLTKCTREGCTYSERTEGEAALGHTGGAATCQTRAICDRCGKPYGGYGSHVWDNGTVTAGDCQHRAYTTYHCTVDGCTSTKKENGSFGEHDYWVVSQTQPTCTEQGDVVKRCQVCGDEIHAYTDALGHDVAEWVLEGTEAKGVCRRCGQTVTTTPAAAGLTHKCEKCGLVHEGRTGIFVENGLYCKIIGFFRRIFSMFS